jgi:hypothetical protein
MANSISVSRTPVSRANNRQVARKLMLRRDAMLVSDVKRRVRNPKGSLMRAMKTLVCLIIPVVAIGLTGCEPTAGIQTSASAQTSSSASDFGPVGGIAPPPGRTDAERRARRDYMRGPRGNEF